MNQLLLKLAGLVLIVFLLGLGWILNGSPDLIKGRREVQYQLYLGTDSIKIYQNSRYVGTLNRNENPRLDHLLKMDNHD